MIKIILSIALLVSSLFAEDITIATGEKSGSYYKYGELISKNIFKNKAKVLNTTGSVDNMLLVADGIVDVAFVQADALEMLDIFYKSSNKKTSDLVEIVGKLYAETLHIIVDKNSGIKNLKNLNGKVMSAGGQKSGSSVTASYIENEFDIQFSRVVSASIENSLRLLKQKKVDVIFYVSKSPSDLLKRYDNIKLLNVDKEITNNKHIKRTIVKKNNYRFLEKDLHTYSVDSLVIVKKGFKDMKKISKYFNMSASTENTSNAKNSNKLVFKIPINVLTNYTNLYGNRALVRMNFIDAHLSRLKNEKTLVKLKEVNEIVNRLKYDSDLNVWKKKNKWATPLQSLGTGLADIEEYALIKSLFLTKIGINPKKLKLIQKDIPFNFNGEKNSKNITLAYFHKANKAPVILDYTEGAKSIYKYKNQFKYNFVKKSEGKTWNKILKNNFNSKDAEIIMSRLK
ncbi:TAXI family TRAP transporter solute-binding subunit [Arcobacteraceae bacterium]|nr:TAXI family TRAP transporter solute-binding subunit [Arcobacteraceae bacterium]